MLFHDYSNEAYIQDEQGKRENEEPPPPIINGSAIAMSLLLNSVCVALKSIMYDFISYMYTVQPIVNFIERARRRNARYHVLSLHALRC